MFRVDQLNVAGSLPAPAAVGAPGYFQDPNPAISQPGTQVPADWLNAVQEELIAVIVAGGGTANKTVRTQVRDAIAALIAVGASATAIQAQAGNYATAGGTANAITATFSPAVGAHVTGAPLRVKIATSNTGAVSFNPGPGVKNAIAPDGSALVDGDLIAGAIKTFVYDGTNYLVDVARATGAQGASGLVVTNNVATPNTKIDITADEVAAVDSIGRVKRVSAVSVTIDLGTTGANGLDTGVQAVSTWYKTFVMVKSDGTVAGFASTSATPTLPSGYIYKFYAGSMRSGAATTLLRTKQLGSRARYIVTAATNTTLLPQMVAPANAQTRIAIPVGAFVPPTATQIAVVVAQDGSVGNSVIVAPSNDAGYTAAGGSLPANPVPLASFGGGGTSVENGTVFGELNLESTNLYYSSGSNSATHSSINAYGWTDKVNAA